MCFFIMLNWFLLLSSLSAISGFFSPVSLISLISYLLLFLRSDRSPLPNCCSDLTPTQAIKSREATVGTWTTSGRMGRQNSLHFFLSPPFYLFSFTICLRSPIFYNFLFNTVIFLSLLSTPFCHFSVFYPPFLSVCLSLSPFPLTLLIDLSG